MKKTKLKALVISLIFSLSILALSNKVLSPLPSTLHTTVPGPVIIPEGSENPDPIPPVDPIPLILIDD